MVKNTILLLLVTSVYSSINAQVSIPLTLNPATATRLTLTQNTDGSSSITTTGADPYISVIDITTTYDFNTTYYISFDYISTAGLDNLSVFFGTPTSDRSVNLGAIKPSTTYKTVNINMKRSANWNAFFSKLRFDFGSIAGQSITVKNLRIRQPTQQDLDNDPFVVQKIQETQLNTYLTTAFTAKVNKVKVDTNKVSVNLTIPNNTGNLFLCELRMYDPVFKPENIVFASPLSNATSIQTTLDRYVTIRDTTYDRIYSRWVIAEKNGATYTYKSNARFADDVSEVAKKYFPEVKPLSKKGVGGFGGPQAVSDLPQLGLHNVTVNVTYANLISLTPTSLSYVFNGATYYFNPTTVAGLDLSIKGATSNNALVSAIILIPINASAALKQILTHPDANDGYYSIANVTTLTGVNYYAAITAFLADRYTRTDNLNGRITNWIIHNEVDAGKVWTNAGEKAMNVYTELYDRSMRTVYYTIRQFNPAGKVFISLTHRWATAINSENYKPRDILTTLNTLNEKQGDYEWGLAYHPYPENLFNYRTWDDTKNSLNLDNSFFITPKNIELIDTWMRRKANLYQGLKVRSLMFSEQGIHGGGAYDQPTFINQAAGVAYMWKKFNRLPSLEAIQYHRRVDNRNEGGLYLGLWTTNLSSTSFEVQDYKKKSWYVWQSAGTPKEADSMAFALPIIGVSSWDETFNPINGEVLPHKINFNLTNQGAVVNDVDIYFNGEMRKTQSAGAATFFNVATSTQARNYRFIKNGQLLWRDIATTVNNDQAISVNLDPLSNLSASSENTTSITLKWQDITDFEKGFIIEYKPDNTTVFTKLDSVAANQTTFTHTGLLLNKKYDYRIYAYNDTIKTLYSPIISGTVGVRTNTFDTDDEKVTVRVFPNPSKGTIYLDINDYNGKKLTVRLLDISGKTVQQETLNTTSNKGTYSINLKKEQPMGTYLLEVSGDNLKRVLKVFIE
jgi:hypothetical protein